MAAPSAGTDAASAAGAWVSANLVEPWQTLLRDHPLLGALVLVPLGVAFLLYGFRLYRWLVVISYAVVGMVLGVAVSAWLGVNLSLAVLVGAVLLGLLAWPLHRAAWGLLGGIVFALLALTAADLAGIRGWPALVVIGLVALVAGVALTVLLLRPLIILNTSLMGGACLAAGSLRLATLCPGIGPPVAALLEARPYVVGLVVLVLAALGVLLQLVDTAGGKRKKGSDGRG